MQGMEDHATWNQAKAYMIRIDRLLSEGNFYSINDQDYIKWGGILLAVFREVSPFIYKIKNKDELENIKTLRNSVIKYSNIQNPSPQVKGLLYSACNDFNVALMKVLDDKGILIPKGEDILMRA